MTGEQRIYTLTALTDIWTGDAYGKPRRLITTGLLGSIRWWFEVVVRGLGGSACDPTLDGNRCPNPKKDPADPGHHCVVCELFGCTGWARKFRFDVLDKDGKAQREQIRANQSFQLRFTPLRPIRDEEWALLDLTIRLIAEYGAVGGKTVYKPTDEQSRQNAAHHRDYGLVRVENNPKIEPETIDHLRSFVGDSRWRHVNHVPFTWASVANFWCVKGRYLARQGAKQSSFNHVLGRKEDKSEKERKGNRVVRSSDLLMDSQDEASKWLAGGRADSKKVFSFKEPARTFGFVQDPDKLDEMRQRLRDKAWPDLQEDEFLTGEAILGSLLGGGGTA